MPFILLSLRVGAVTENGHLINELMRAVSAILAVAFPLDLGPQRTPARRVDHTHKVATKWAATGRDSLGSPAV
ncbi:hypothetical protein [Paraburkholderia sp. BL6665CI2N2]|uniref:hypothetical protein n=1 Tax=Paraburkholderia sp. BL6665CI2N2 TaxID=1938806 RepID=UPI0014170A2E|nr:hypothetical protein [Paraburkholderia sp. BL6665CI2N2]